MGRRASVSTDEILAAARELFVERGIDASTAEIARRAHVSEGSIFRRFPTKQALFFAAMGADETPTWIEQLDRLSGADPEGELIELALRMIDSVRSMLPRIMLLWSCRDHQAVANALGCKQSMPHQVVSALTDFFDRWMRQGKLSATDPEIVARVFVGSIFNYCFLETMGIEIRGPLSATSYATALVETLFQGISPSSGDTP